MIKYKYIIDSGNFSSIEEFQAHLNRMGAKGYELVQWQVVNFINCCSTTIQPTSDTLSTFITWKIEDHDS
jgi:hypothetical protein